MAGSDIISTAQELITKIDPAILEAATKGLATAICKVIGATGIKLLAQTEEKILDGAGNLTKAAQDLLMKNILMGVLFSEKSCYSME